MYGALAARLEKAKLGRKARRSMTKHTQAHKAYVGQRNQLFWRLHQRRSRSAFDWGGLEDHPANEWAPPV